MTGGVQSNLCEEALALLRPTTAPLRAARKTANSKSCSFWPQSISHCCEGLDSIRDQEESSTSVAGFRAACVFDVSQTDGKELPKIGAVQVTRADVVSSSVVSRLRWPISPMPSSLTTSCASR